MPEINSKGLSVNIFLSKKNAKYLTKQCKPRAFNDCSYSHTLILYNTRHQINCN